MHRTRPVPSCAVDAVQSMSFATAAAESTYCCPQVPSGISPTFFCHGRTVIHNCWDAPPRQSKYWSNRRTKRSIEVPVLEPHQSKTNRVTRPLAATHRQSEFWKRVTSQSQTHARIRIPRRKPINLGPCAYGRQPHGRITSLSCIHGHGSCMICFARAISCAEQGDGENAK